MLYSSSRESLKRGLGFSLFAADYYCNEKGDLSWDEYKRSVNDVSGEPLSEVELLKKEEAALERDTSTKSNAMGDLPFEILPETTEALAAFSSGGTDGPGVLALSLENEKVKLSHQTSIFTWKKFFISDWIVILRPQYVSEQVGVYSSPSIPSAAALASAEGQLSEALLDATKPAYVLCRLNLNFIFIYYCPEEAPVKAKMVYSTAKATVMGVAANRLVESQTLFFYSFRLMLSITISAALPSPGLKKCVRLTTSTPSPPPAPRALLRTPQPPCSLVRL